MKYFAILIALLSTACNPLSSNFGKDFKSEGPNNCQKQKLISNAIELQQSPIQINGYIDESINNQSIEVSEEFIQLIHSAYEKGIHEIHFPLPITEDKTINAISQKIKLKNGTYLVSGVFPDDIDGYFSFALRKNILIGDLNYYFDNYSIKLSSDGDQILSKEQNIDLNTACGFKHKAEVDMNMLYSSSTNVMESVSVDLFIAYTTASKEQIGGEESAKALVELITENLNADLERSGVEHRVRLVGSMEVPQEATGAVDTDLFALQDTSDGRWDEVHEAAKNVGSDQVAILVEGSNSGTIGYAGGPNSRRGYFSATRIGAAKGIVFSHELGHNYGAMHEDGYESVEGNFSTIMSYSNLRKTRYFSSTNILKDGFATGDATHDSVSQILRYMPQASEFREEVVPVPPSPTPPNEGNNPPQCKI